MARWARDLQGRAGAGVWTGTALDDPQGASVTEMAEVGFRVEGTLWTGRYFSLALGPLWCWPGSPVSSRELRPRGEGLEKKPSPPPPRRPVFTFQFKNPLILLLLASALVSILTKEYEDAVSIAAVSARGSVSAPHGGVLVNFAVAVLAGSQVASGSFLWGAVSRRIPWPRPPGWNCSVPSVQVAHIGPQSGPL